LSPIFYKNDLARRGPLGLNIGKTGEASQREATAQKIIRSSSVVVMNDKHVKQSRPMTSKPRSNSTNKAQVVFNQKARGSVGTYSKSHAKIQPPAITKDELKKTLVYLEKNRKFGSYSIDGHEEPAGVRIGDYHVSNNTLHAKMAPIGHHEGGK
jgi:hypothetical protein